jgi:hypothetical protein
MGAKFNLNLSDTAYEEVGELSRKLDLSMADVVREALSLLWWISKEIGSGNRLLIQRGDQVTELLYPGLERLRTSDGKARKERESLSRPARGRLTSAR